MVEISNILEFLEKQRIIVEYVGEKSTIISNYSSLDDLKDNSITWIKTLDNLSKIQSKTGLNIVIVTTKEIAEHIETGNVLIVDYPKMVFFQIISNYFVKKEVKGISPTAIIKTVKIGENVSIGDYCHIGEEVTIGNNVTIMNSVNIECPTVIGNNCIISSGVIIGTNGFGYYKDMEGNNTLVPHTGGVVIGDNVDIGANTCIDRGTINNTVIGDFTKIDNLCHIAHNVQIGKNVFIIANSMIGGSAVLEDNVYVAPGVKVMNQVHMKRNAFAGMGAVVNKDVDENKVVAGIPAKVLRSRTTED